MPSKFPTVRISPLQGLNKRDDKYNMKTGDLLYGPNVFCNNDGSIERVKGYENLFDPISTTESICHSIFEWKRYDGSRDIVFLHDDDLYIITSYHSNPSYALLLAGMSSGKKIRYVHYNDYLFFGNAFDANKVVTPNNIHIQLGTVETTDNATDLASVKTLFNALKAKYNTHIASTVLHAKADATNTVASADLDGGSDQAAANAACNELKGDFNGHLDETKVHVNNDIYRTITAADASSEATSITLINQAKALYNQHVQACRVMDWCATAPTTAPTLGGAGNYGYCYTFYDKENGVESAPSPLATSKAVGELTAMDVSTDPNITHKRIYRTFTSGATYYRVTEIVNQLTAYTDSAADADLGTALVTEDCDVVPLTSIFCLHKDRIYLSGNMTDPYRVYYTEPTYPTLYKPAYSFQDFDVSVTGIASIPNGLLIFEKHKTWLWLNPPFGNAPVVLSGLVGCTNAESIVSIDGTLVFRDPSGNTGVLDNPVVWQSEHGIFASNGAAPVCISEYINKEYVNCDLNSAVTVHDAFNNRLYAIVGSG